MTRSFNVFFHLRLKKTVEKQSGGWWFETPSHSLWCHCDGSTEWKGIPSPGKTVFVLADPALTVVTFEDPMKYFQLLYSKLCSRNISTPWAYIACPCIVISLGLELSFSYSHLCWCWFQNEQRFKDLTALRFFSNGYSINISARVTNPLVFNTRAAFDHCWQLHAGQPIRPSWEKYNTHLLMFTWKISILTDLTERYVLENISSRI